MWSNFKTRVDTFLNKPGREWLFILTGILVVLIKRRRLVRIYRENGIWVHRYKDGVITDRKINYRATLDKYQLKTKDHWLFIYQPKPGDIIFDIGAGKGENTYYLSKMAGPGGKVFSIEAHPQTFLCLEKFCEYNKLTNVIPLNLAICDKESYVMINNPELDVSSTIVNTANGIKVKSTSLDLLVKKYNLDYINYIKMNIEGAEILALRGMTDCIKITKYVCISGHDFIGGETGNNQMQTADAVIRFLQQNNFRITLRTSDSRPYIRDQINGTNMNLI